MVESRLNQPGNGEKFVFLNRSFLSTVGKTRDSGLKNILKYPTTRKHTNTGTHKPLGQQQVWLDVGVIQRGVGTHGKGLTGVTFKPLFTW